MLLGRSVAVNEAKAIANAYLRSEGTSLVANKARRDLEKRGGYEATGTPVSRLPKVPPGPAPGSSAQTSNTPASNAPSED